MATSKNQFLQRLYQKWGDQAPSLSKNVTHTFGCKKCGRWFNSGHDILYKRVYPYCTKCAIKSLNRTRYARNLIEVHAYLKKRGLRMLGPFQGDHARRRFLCLRCKYVFSSSMHGVNCKRCNAANIKDPERTLAVCKERGLIEGYKDCAVRYLLESGIKPNRIVHSEGRIPTFEYEFLGRQRKYQPAILISPKTIVEVKSTYAMTKIGGMDTFEKTQAKGIAVLEKGYKFRLLLVDNPVGVIEPDPRWLHATQDYLDAFVFFEKTFSILAFDPGVKNMGYALLDISVEKGLKYRIVETGCIRYPVHDLNVDVKGQVNCFVSEVLGIMDSPSDYKIAGVVAERYMTRGLKGTQIEAVSLMLGALTQAILSNHSETRVRLIPASSWKNAVSKNGIVLNDVYRMTGIQPHEIDAVFMGLYYAGLLTGINTYERFKDKSRIRAMIRSLEGKTTSAFRKKGTM